MPPKNCVRFVKTKPQVHRRERGARGGIKVKPLLSLRVSGKKTKGLSSQSFLD